MYKRVFLVTFLTVWAAVVSAQFRVRIILDMVPAAHAETPVFIAGTLNNWNPGDPHYQFNLVPPHDGILLPPLPAGPLLFKFTRGSWQTVECQSDGRDRGNREIYIRSDTIIHCGISAWKDAFVQTPKTHTMSPQVEIIDTAFWMPQLERSRRIWIYLPPDYKLSAKKFPVIYMQDGQNLFDASTSAYGEWGVDEILDSLYQKGIPGSIVVGIDHGGDKRLTEYNPYDNPTYGKGEGAAYARFLVETLKPFIDRHFRTLADPRHTGIAGSSMGGLISFYTWLKYPTVFGKAGIFSPSFWIAPQIREAIPRAGIIPDREIYFIAGDAESASMVPDMKTIYQDLTLHGMGGENMQLKIVKGGKHSESYWKQEFPNMYLWLFVDQAGH